MLAHIHHAVSAAASLLRLFATLACSPLSDVCVRERRGEDQCESVCVCVRLSRWVACDAKVGIFSWLGSQLGGWEPTVSSPPRLGRIPSLPPLLLAPFHPSMPSV
uniref:Secreted protein n=1 Tax=Oryza brachyantha TaxID=4533 RepID=J3L9B3_ORYBR